MNIKVTPGHYIVAVSGGVDSVALLHMLRDRPGLTLTVAHYDHGIRPDSGEDRKHVQSLAKQYGLPFVYREGHLGPATSEATARRARYEFLHAAKKAAKAKAIITAHHQDDVLETGIHNILRGSGRKGLTSLKSTNEILRPLLHVPKKDIKTYAKKHGLKWREDITNQDVRYRRNYIRHNIIPKLTHEQCQKLLELVKKTTKLNEIIDKSLINYLHQQPAHNELARHSFVMLPHKVALEVMASWLRAHDIRDFDKRLLERLVAKAKTLATDKQIDVNYSYIINVSGNKLALIPRER